MKNIRVFLSENFQFLEVKFSIYSNRRVFVMRNYESLMADRQYIERIHAATHTSLFINLNLSLPVITKTRLFKYTENFTT